MKLRGLNQQIITLLIAVILLGMGAARSLSNPAGRGRSIVKQFEEQFPTLASQIRTRSRFTTRDEHDAVEARRFIVPVEEVTETSMPGGLKPEEASAWLAAEQRLRGARRDRLQLGYPARYDEATVADAHGVHVELRAVNANPAPIEIEEGKVVYRNVYPGTDSMHVYRDGESEEFLLLRDENAPVRFEYELKMSEGVQVSLDGGEVRLVKDQRQGLVIPSPWIVDADGQRREDVVRWAVDEQFAGVLKLVLELNPAELSYPIVVDPGWRTTGSLHTARRYHTATLLTNGKVLVVGGWLNNGVVLSTCEVYDPATGVWTYTGNLNHRRYGHTATLLTNGKVLVAGGFADGSVISNDTYSLAGAELYDPTTGIWSYTSGMNQTRGFHTATLLSNGKVLVVGGFWNAFLNTGGPTNSVDSYDPVAGAWTPKDPLHEGRYYHTATLLNNGKVLVAGGRGDNSFQRYPTAVELYNPATGAWMIKDPLPGGRVYHTATLLQNGKVLMAGGFNDEGGFHYLNTSFVYTPATGGWTSAGFLNDARCGQTATLMPSGKVLVAGGYHVGKLRSAELYDPATGVWSFTNNLNTVRSGHSAVLMPDGKVMVAGDGTSVEFYDPTFCPICKVLTEGERQ